MNAEVTKFLEDEDLQWKSEIIKLRSILLTTDLEEDFKWDLPCYTYKKKNVVIIQPFKACLGFMFFKGSLLKDAKKLLTSNGPNSQAGRRFEFTSVQEISKLSSTIKSYIKEAIQIEEKGEKVQFEKKNATVPEELMSYFKKSATFKKAFYGLTPGRQRAYLLHFSGAKQSATRLARIEKCKARIIAGKGLMD